MLGRSATIWRWVTLWAGASAATSSPASGPAAGRIPPPHPQITEVLFNVPAGAAGDANRDGARHAAGDEFIELANPHDEAIDLAGYVVHNRRSSFAGSSGGVRFVFPAFELAPGAVCVVFNGCEASIPGPVGDESAAPAEGNPGFKGAHVFSMRTSSKSNALANTADWVVVCAPDGSLIDCVWWGEPDPPAPAGPVRSQGVAADPKGSVQRVKPSGALEPHRSINGQPFSPGWIPDRAGASPRR